MTTNPANTLKALDPYWQSIQNGAPRALRNLDELEPCTTRVTSDQALASEAAIKHCVNLISREIIRLHGIVSQFDYTVAGEFGDMRATSERWENEHAVEGCKSCGREDVVIFTVTDPKWGTSGLCTWCGWFKYTTGFLPTPTLLFAHWDGPARRMSKALVDRELKPLREAEAKRRAVKRTTRKKGKTAA